MKFGGQTVTFVSVTEDPSVLDDLGKPRVVRTSVDVSGCLFRAVEPTYRDEKLNKYGDLTVDEWRCTAPPLPTVMNAKATDEVIVNGKTYQIQVGARTFYTLRGTPFKCTVICESRGG